MEAAAQARFSEASGGVFGGCGEEVKVLSAGFMQFSRHFRLEKLIVIGRINKQKLNNEGNLRLLSLAITLSQL
jgi:hypothetical protein